MPLGQSGALSGHEVGYLPQTLDAEPTYRLGGQALLVDPASGDARGVDLTPEAAVDIDRLSTDGDAGLVGLQLADDVIIDARVRPDIENIISLDQDHRPGEFSSKENPTSSSTLGSAGSSSSNDRT